MASLGNQSNIKETVTYLNNPMRHISNTLKGSKSSM